MKLYKYLHPGRIDILRNKEIRFTQPGSFNDPFEIFPAFERIMTETGFDKLMNEGEPVTESLTWDDVDIEGMLKKEMPQLDGKKIARTIKQSISVQDALKLIVPDFYNIMKSMATSNDSDFMKQISDSIKLNWNTKFGVLCLSENWDNLIMWAHYADSHKGFVIAFDSQHSFFNQRKSQDDKIRFVKPVIYATTRPEITAYDPQYDEDQMMANLANNILFTKSIHWSDEKEWRLIYALEDAKRVLKDDIYLFDLPPSCVTDIIFGCRSSDDLKKDITELINADPKLAHIQIHQAGINYHEYALSLS